MPKRALGRLSALHPRFALRQTARARRSRRQRLVAGGAVLLVLPALSFSIPASTSGASTARLVHARPAAARPVEAAITTPGGSTVLASPPAISGVRDVVPGSSAPHTLVVGKDLVQAADPLVGGPGPQPQATTVIGPAPAQPMPAITGTPQSRSPKLPTCMPR